MSRSLQKQALQKQAILSLLNTEQYEIALQHALSWLDESPNNIDALYVSGLAYLFTEQFEKSIDNLTQAIKLSPENAIYIANLGIAYLRAGNIKAAITNLKTAVKLQPDYEIALYNLGSAYIKNNEAKLAIDRFKSLTELQPDNADYLCALADAIRETGQWLQSIQVYKKSLKVDANNSRAHTNMGPLMMHLGQLEDAVKHCLRAIEIEPEQTLARKNLGDCYVQMEQLDDAMETYADAFELDANNIDLIVAIGNTWLETAEYVEASSWFNKANQLDNENVSALCGLAHIERELGNLQSSLDILQPLLEKNSENVEVLYNLSDTLWDDGDANAALQHLKTIQKLQPQRTAIYAKIGQILSSAGDVNGALQQYKTALGQNSRCIPVLNGLATTQRGKLQPQHIETIQKLLASNSGNNRLSSGSLAALHNGLAFYLDGSKQFKAAAEHMEKANHYQWQHKTIRGWQYDSQKHEDYTTDLIQTFTPEYFKRVESLGSKDISPVFVVAMPRSGTTLIEQILARHKNVLGIGERNFVSQTLNQFTRTDEKIKLEKLNNTSESEIKELSQNYLKKLNSLVLQSNETDITRIIDKMPDNYNMIGWILTLFPHAKIIHLQRDPADIALSCWMTQFSSIRWACHKEHITHRIQQYQRIMQHWREVAPGRFFETSYEKLVHNQQEESERLIEYIGLEWDENCLKFYDSDRLIRTASITQVRQPIYNTSVRRWKTYQAYIPDLFTPFHL